MRTLIAFAIAAFAASLSTPATARALWEYEWIEVRTPHFAIQSALPEDKTVALAVDLENFRAAVELLTSIERFDERIPTRVYLLPRPDKGLGTSGLAGYMAADMRANYLVVLQAQSSTDDVLKHEYVHFLVHNRDQALYPAWFDEGFAEVLSTLSVVGNVIEYGKPDSNQESWLRYGTWLPFLDVLEARSPRSPMYYAQSWFLTHYLMIGKPDGRFGDENREFRRLVEAGEKPAAAFEQAFGLHVGELKRTLLDYARKMTYARLTLKEPFPAPDLSIVTVTSDDIAAQLGLLCILQGDEEAAHRYFGAALAANADNAAALVGMGDLHKFDERYDEAKPYYEKAIALEPGNALHLLDYAEYWADRAKAQHDRQASHDYLVEARRQFARSYKLDPDNPETLAMNGATYIDDGAAASKAVVSLEAAHQLLPSQPEIRLLLARAYLAAGQPEMARPHLRTLLAWSHSDKGEKELLRLLEQADRPVAPATGDEEAAPASATAPAAE